MFWANWRLTSGYQCIHRWKRVFRPWCSIKNKWKHIQTKTHLLHFHQMDRLWSKYQKLLELWSHDPMYRKCNWSTQSTILRQMQLCLILWSLVRTQLSWAKCQYNKSSLNHIYSMKFLRPRTPKNVSPMLTCSVTYSLQCSIHYSGMQPVLLVLQLELYASVTPWTKKQKLTTLTAQSKVSCQWTLTTFGDSSRSLMEG